MSIIRSFFLSSLPLRSSRVTAFWRSSASLLVPSALLLSACSTKKDGLASTDPYTGYGSSDFPYDAAGNYVGAGGNSGASTADTGPPSLTYEDSSSDVAASFADNTPNNPSYTQDYADTSSYVSPAPDYSTPTPPSSSSSSSSSSYASSSSSSSSSAASSSSSSSSRSYNRYRVRRGDTLTAIARRYGTSVSAIRRANNMSGSRIITGQTINVPGSAPSGRSSASATHRVRRGDTLYSIARKYGTSVSAIKRANGMSSNTIIAGRSLRIP